ncbi:MULTISPECIES: ATP-dependent DNA helicase RecG [Prochlorococcus]|uniref:ATP-dependent DNA helicase RecG n=1 Tax=Prochlorococcus marinus str. MIT 9116 TaxID=167544 RepID=A0A0A1ZVY6_PROMR|nr:ATP-dependent DNA helicase RecG [Prochlorococcus marinus]KGF89716.1 ATP-dependent DNA helicase RecG [Prochlorococcus marinus str. MIT 9107]KGF92434.1 ATP-dependent DNA helicase RecG [Prochlorococcus marinus str. MIT 9116]KGF92754.1 ATP-dependent DNA helicase RecG [Prochlorococcus marinus str. MIT 9123]
MTINENYIKLIKDWIRPLQKSLTIETESNFINTLGRKKYFNDYLYESFLRLENLNLADEYLRKFNEFSKKYNEYNKLDFNQRKKLIIDTRKVLYKLGKNLEIKNSYNYSNKGFLNKIDSGLSLDSDILLIKNVGKVYKNKLNELGIFNIKDLINYFPRTYLDYTNRVKIINLKPDNLYTCLASIKRFYIYKSKKNSNLSIMNFVVSDDTSSIKVTKFFLGKKFRSYSFFSSQKSIYTPGTKLAISGKVKMTNYGKTFADPQIEILKYNNDNLNFSGRILPLYSLAEELSNMSFIKLMKKVLIYAKQYPEILNQKQLDSLSLLSKGESLINIHLPPTQEALIKSKKRLVFDELFLLQIKFLLRKKKANQNILAKELPQKKSLLKEFLNSFPFELTKSQVKVLEEIKNDLLTPVPMSRLLQGDVGSGKTIIAIASLLIVIEKNSQGAFMAPTEVLAEQHYKNLLKYLNPLLVSVELLTGNTPQRKRREILSNLNNGQVDILVGTHALFEDKVIFNSLGMVVIDEQHRFGVTQRNRLLNKGDNTNLLSMTATPIPRTLALSIYGDLDVSQITELPPGRVPITTKIISEDELTDLFEIIEGEITKGRQAYVILPLIEDSEKMNLNSAKKIFKYLSEEVFFKKKVGLLHGKLNSQEKNEVINSFLKNEINVLVSTTVIEVGIDVPNASIMVIYNSERFGLSQLHQLRGRVGRGSTKSFCYLVSSDINGLENKRLGVLQKSNDGFYIAEKDLELRGPGQILGYRQSGLPDFVLDNLPNNKFLIEMAREEAIKVIRNDPDLKENIVLRNILIDNCDNKFIHDFLN